MFEETEMRIDVICSLLKLPFEVRYFQMALQLF